MRTADEPPEPLDVRGSILKLCVFTLFVLPFALLAPWIAISLISPPDINIDLVTFRLWALGMLVFCLAMGGLIYRYWQVMGVGKTVLELTPAGLVIPVLGSNKPIPWRDVYAARHKSGIWLSLTVDPNVHTRRFGLKGSWFGGRADRASLYFLPVFNMSVSKLLRTIRRFKEWDRNKSTSAE